MDIIERKIQVEIKFFFSEARCPTGAVYYLELCVLRGGGGYNDNVEPKVNFHSERERSIERGLVLSPLLPGDSLTALQAYNLCNDED